MKRLLAILLLSGCGAEREPASDGTAQEGAATAAAALQDLPATGGETPEQLQAKAGAAMRGILLDAPSARYLDVRAGSVGSICGRVDSKQAGGKRSGYLPFVVTPEGVAIVSSSAEVNFGDPVDMFPDFYIRWCASPAEMAGIAARIADGPGSPEPDLPIVDQGAAPVLADAGGADGVVSLPAEPAPPSATRTPTATAPSSSGDESFFNAVLRPGEKERP